MKRLDPEALLQHVVSAHIPTTLTPIVEMVRGLKSQHVSLATALTERKRWKKIGRTNNWLLGLSCACLVGTIISYYTAYMTVAVGLFLLLIPLGISLACSESMVKRLPYFPFEENIGHTLFAIQEFLAAFKKIPDADFGTWQRDTLVNWCKQEFIAAAKGALVARAMGRKDIYSDLNGDTVDMNRWSHHAGITLPVKELWERAEKLAGIELASVLNFEI
jgi:hypothetical protein